MRVGGKFSFSIVGLGTLFCWVFFPFLGSELPPTLVYSNQSVISVYYCICASVLTCVGLSCVITGQLDFKDFAYSPVVGGVIIGSSAAFISNESGALILGIIGGVVHCFLQRW